MILSTQEGQGAPSNSIDKPICLPAACRRDMAGVFPIDPRLRLSLACGVGNKEQSLPCVWGTHGARGEHAPLRIVPDLGQVCEDSPKEVSVVRGKDTWYVLCDNVSWANLDNDAGELSPQVSFVT